MGKLFEKQDKKKVKKQSENKKGKEKTIIDRTTRTANTYPPIIRTAVVSNIGSRSNQQDNYGISDVMDTELKNEKGILTLVADGMGGLNNGAEVSGIVVAIFQEYFRSVHFEGENPLELLNMVQEANKNVLKYIDCNGGGMSGSTVVATIIKQNMMHFISVGDSRIYLMRGGKLLQLNREHIYATELDELAAKKKISMSEAYGDSQRNSLTSYIGMDKIEYIDFNREPLELIKGDKVLLMSDGVFGTLSNDEIANCLGGKVLEHSVEMLEAAVLRKGKPSQDNFTAVVVSLE